jgi:hypothetical protein
MAIWIVLAIVIAGAANTRGRDAAFWLFFAIIASPLVAVIFLLAFPSRNAPERSPANEQWLTRPAHDGRTGSSVLGPVPAWVLAECPLVPLLGCVLGPAYS